MVARRGRCGTCGWRAPMRPDPPTQKHVAVELEADRNHVGLAVSAKRRQARERLRPQVGDLLVGERHRGCYEGRPRDRGDHLLHADDVAVAAAHVVERLLVGARGAVADALARARSATARAASRRRPSRARSRRSTRRRRPACRARRAATRTATPKNAEACALTRTGSSSRRPSRGSISTQRVPGRSTFSAGDLAQEDGRGRLPHVVVDDRGEEDRHAGAARPRRARAGAPTSTSSRSHASGDDGSVKPKLRSTTTTAGRSPNPAAPPKSATARPLQRGLAALQRRPAQRLGRRRRRQPGLGLAVRERLLDRRPEVERQRVAALGPLARPLGLRRRPRRRRHAVAALSAFSTDTSPNATSRSTASTGRSSRSFQPPPPAVR